MRNSVGSIERADTRQTVTAAGPTRRGKQIVIPPGHMRHADVQGGREKTDKIRLRWIFAGPVSPDNGMWGWTPPGGTASRLNERVRAPAIAGCAETSLPEVTA